MIDVCYIYTPGFHTPGQDHYRRAAIAFVDSIINNPPGVDCRYHIVCQGHLIEPDMIAVFNRLGSVSFVGHDDSGWDIGGFVAMAKILHQPPKTDPMLCFGGNSSVRKAGWLKRLDDVWKKEGPGIYGTQSTYQVRPHLNTTGFMCLPHHLLRYPKVIIHKVDRYDFEHGFVTGKSWWEQMYNEGEKVKLVTWDGEYEWPEWRTPPNILCRGDQSNCVTFFRIAVQYAAFGSNTFEKEVLERAMDIMTDPSFIKAAEIWKQSKQVSS